MSHCVSTYRRSRPRRGMMVGGAAAVWLMLAPGCRSGVGVRDVDQGGLTSERAAYFREQARQVFGTDLIRVEPLREATMSAEEYSKARRQLDLRVVASSAPKPGPVLADRQGTSSRDWWESDRPIEASTPAHGPPARGVLANDDPARRDAAEGGEDQSIARAAVSGGVSPWDVDVGRDRRSRAKAEENAAANGEAGKVGDEGVAAESGSGRPEIDPAFRDMFGSATTPDFSAPRVRPESTGGTANGGGGAGGWSIVIAVFRGEDQDEVAKQALQQVQTEGGLREAYIQRRGQATTICYGRYGDADDAAAQADLKRVQSFEIQGVRPYATTYLSPPAEAAAPIRSEYDLRTVKRKFGKDALYTLQVGFYGREDVRRLSVEDRKTVQQAAEQAAADLRKEGEQAFFYHGPNRSMVTVGVFGADDFDPMNPAAESARLREARRRHPLNLYNGQGYTGKTPGMREAKLVPSALVAVPEK